MYFCHSIDKVDYFVSQKQIKLTTFTYTALMAQSVCKYSLLIPPRPRSLLLRSTQLHLKKAKKKKGKPSAIEIETTQKFR